MNTDISKAGPGTLVLSEDGSGYSGAITVEEGTMVADVAGSLGTGAVNVAPYFSGSALLSIEASQTLTSLTIADGGTVILSEPVPPAPPGLSPQCPSRVRW